MLNSYDLGYGLVTVGSRIVYLPAGERAQAGVVEDITQDGDVTVCLDNGPTWAVTTKWRYVFPEISKGL